MDIEKEQASSSPTSLSIHEKRKLVYELSEWEGASEVIKSWNRQEILQILSAETGKERKYTGLPKLKIIEQLLKTISSKKLNNQKSVSIPNLESTLFLSQRPLKKQRKISSAMQLSFSANYNLVSSDRDVSKISYCKNSACRAKLKPANLFCKRCSCCICRQYDDNKDPSLWLVCCSEPPCQGIACGMSCHLRCAFQHENSGLGNGAHNQSIDGCFLCVACGKVNDLLGCLKKQLMIAKDTRRVDVLAYRISLCQKLLAGTTKHVHILAMVDEAAKNLEDEIGPLTGLPVNMGRAIVNRLSCGPEVQKLCNFALETLEKLLLESAPPSPYHATTQDSSLIDQLTVRIEDILSTSIAVVLSSSEGFPADSVHHTIWHRKSSEECYPSEPTGKLAGPNARFVVTGLVPAMEYQLKVVSSHNDRQLGMCESKFATSDTNLCETPNSMVMDICCQSPATNDSTLSNPYSVEDENNYCSEMDKSGRNCSEIHLDEVSDMVPLPLPAADTLKVGTSMDFDVQAPSAQFMMEGRTGDGSDLTNPNCTPSNTKLEAIGDVINGRYSRSDTCRKGDKEEGQLGSSSMLEKMGGEKEEEELMHSDEDFEYHVKLIRWLECKGYIDKSFRQKFLTWYGLQATPQDMRIVKTFVSVFTEDPASLAEQLVDTFSNHISSRRVCLVPSGFCMKLWHS